MLDTLMELLDLLYDGTGQKSRNRSSRGMLETLIRLFTQPERNRTPEEEMGEGLNMGADKYIWGRGPSGERIGQPWPVHNFWSRITGGIIPAPAVRWWEERPTGIREMWQAVRGSGDRTCVATVAPPMMTERGFQPPFSRVHVDRLGVEGAQAEFMNLDVHTDAGYPVLDRQVESMHDGMRQAQADVEMVDGAVREFTGSRAEAAWKAFDKATGE